MHILSQTDARTHGREAHLLILLGRWCRLPCDYLKAGPPIETSPSPRWTLTANGSLVVDWATLLLLPRQLRGPHVPVGKRHLIRLDADGVGLRRKQPVPAQYAKSSKRHKPQQYTNDVSSGSRPATGEKGHQPTLAIVPGVDARQLRHSVT